MPRCFCAAATGEETKLRTSDAGAVLPPTGGVGSNIVSIGNGGSTQGGLGGLVNSLIGG